MTMTSGNGIDYVANENVTYNSAVVAGEVVSWDDSNDKLTIKDNVQQHLQLAMY